MAYSSKAGRKYAYLGMWLGDLGAMDISDFTAKKFYLIDESDNKSVFSGHMTLRDIPQRHKGVPINEKKYFRWISQIFPEMGNIIFIFRV